jgi:hypothetical protein
VRYRTSSYFVVEPGFMSLEGRSCSFMPLDGLDDGAACVESEPAAPLVPAFDSAPWAASSLLVSDVEEEAEPEGALLGAVVASAGAAPPSSRSAHATVVPSARQTPRANVESFIKVSVVGVD